MDGDHGFLAAQRVTGAQQQVVEGVAVLAEYDELAAAAVGREHLGVVLKQARELFPLAVAAGLHDAGGLFLQIPQDDDLGLQLGDGFGRGGLIDHLVGQDLVFLGRQVAGGVVEVLGHVDAALDDVLAQVVTQGIGAGLEVEFVQTAFELLAAA